MSVEEIKRILPGLDAKELDHVIALATFLKRGSSAQAVHNGTSEETLEHTLFEAMEEVLVRYHIKVPHYNLFKRTPSYKKFKEQNEFLEMYFARIFSPRRLTRVQRRKLYKLLFEVQLQTMKTANLMISVNSFVTFMKNAPSLLSDQFPGYMESGLMFRILDSPGLLHGR